MGWEGYIRRQGKGDGKATSRDWLRWERKGMGRIHQEIGWGG